MDDQNKPDQPGKMLDLERDPDDGLPTPFAMASMGPDNPFGTDGAMFDPMAFVEMNPPPGQPPAPPVAAKPAPDVFRVCAQGPCRYYLQTWAEAEATEAGHRVRTSWCFVAATDTALDGAVYGCTAHRPVPFMRQLGEALPSPRTRVGELLCNGLVRLGLRSPRMRGE